MNNNYRQISGYAPDLYDFAQGDSDDALMERIQNYTDYLLDNSSAQEPVWNIEQIRSGKPNKWNYIDGCMITAILSLYDLTGEKKYLDFADAFVDWFVQENGDILTYDPEEKNVDNINTASNLFTLYDLTGKEKYRRAIDTVRHQIDIMPRTKEGNFWHKDIYPWQVWLDGLYMAQPFYMQYETRFNRMHGCQDSFSQFCNVKRLMRDEKTGLYYHAYDESRSMFWADPKTGRSANFWLRSLGWFMCALTDTAQAMNEALYYERRCLTGMLQELTDALLKWQDKSGMFWQVINRPDLSASEDGFCLSRETFGEDHTFAAGEVKGNYLETSGTALIAYAILKGVRLGFLPQRYAAAAKRAFMGIADHYLLTGDDGSLGLGGICLVAGLGGAAKRDGSLAYYFGEPVVRNEAKGTAPFLLAYTELLRLRKEAGHEI